MEKKMARSIRRVIDILLNKEIDEKKYEVKQKKVKTEKRKPMKPMTKDTELREINRRIRISQVQ